MLNDVLVLIIFFFCHFSNNPTHKYFLAVDPVSGALFISDTNSRRIYRVRSLTGGRLLSDNAEVVAGTGEQCLPFDERCGDGGKATEATLMSPKGEPQKKKFRKWMPNYYDNNPFSQLLRKRCWLSVILLPKCERVWGFSMFYNLNFKMLPCAVWNCFLTFDGLN